MKPHEPTARHIVITIVRTNTVSMIVAKPIERLVSSFGVGSCALASCSSVHATAKNTATYEASRRAMSAVAQLYCARTAVKLWLGLTTAFEQISVAHAQLVSRSDSALV